MTVAKDKSLVKVSPYSKLPNSAFWKTAVSGLSPIDFTDLYRPKFNISKTDKIAAAGSCFAQHISRHLRLRGASVMDVEPIPAAVDIQSGMQYGYGVYSGRFGNLYYVRQLLQLIRECYGKFEPANSVWEKEGRFFDALRPAIEPGGLDSLTDVKDMRTSHLKHVRSMFQDCDLFIFTLGLTEAWIHKESGTVYPTAPGTIAGSYDPEIYVFRNFSHSEVLQDLRHFREELHAVNPDAKLLLTISPVSLAATASGEHVLPATVYSKSVLRSAAGQFRDEFPDVDYFPSYEIITSAAARGAYFNETFRDVTPLGVATVMNHFFSQFPHLALDPVNVAQEYTDMDVICEEVLIEAFGK